MLFGERIYLSDYESFDLGDTDTDTDEDKDWVPVDTRRGPSKVNPASVRVPLVEGRMNPWLELILLFLLP